MLARLEGGAVLGFRGQEGYRQARRVYIDHVRDHPCNRVGDGVHDGAPGEAWVGDCRDHRRSLCSLHGAAGGGVEVVLRREVFLNRQPMTSPTVS